MIAGCYFYMSFIPAYIFLMIGFVGINYLAGLKLSQPDFKYRRLIFWTALSINLLALCCLRYLNFLDLGIVLFAKQLHWNLSIPAPNIIAPLGISFQVFQAISYLIEVYRGNFKAKTDLLDLALYFIFFPIVVSGPIERPKNLIPQFTQKHSFTYAQVTGGLKLIAWGIFKKLVIADRLGLLVDPIYNAPKNYSGMPLLVATIAYAFQIYYDFSGYTDMARGVAQVLGFNISINFNQPYLAVSVSDFWRRWHISLSNWLRDYIYYPLLRNNFFRKIPGKLQLAFLITFGISGLWHGPSFHYVVWGGLHGLYLALLVWLEKPNQALQAFFSRIHLSGPFHLFNVVGTFFLVCFAWIFFRANHLNDSLFIINKIAHNLDLNGLKQLADLLGVTLGNNYPVKLMLPNLSGLWIVLILALQIVFAEIVQTILGSQKLSRQFASLPFAARWFGYYALVAMILVFGVADISKFIYFQF